MGILTTKTGRMDITLDLSSRYIFVQQKWKYKWLTDPNYPNLSPWTTQEKRDFHNRSDIMIWKLWSSKAYAFMTGKSSFAQQYKGIRFKINIDIKWVVRAEKEHWKVDVYKIPPGEFRGSQVSWAGKYIILDSEDNKPRGDLAAPNQVPVTHELGHTFRDLSTTNLGILDEYPASSLHYIDKQSIMNAGTEIRSRHFEYLKSKLNLLLPAASFDIKI